MVCQRLIVKWGLKQLEHTILWKTPLMSYAHSLSFTHTYQVGRVTRSGNGSRTNWWYLPHTRKLCNWRKLNFLRFFYGRTKMSYILIHMQSLKNEINSTLNDGKHLILQHIVISIHYYNSNFRALSSAWLNIYIWKICGNGPIKILNYLNRWEHWFISANENTASVFISG